MKNLVESIPQIKIFSLFLEVSESDIQASITTGVKVINNHRGERDASMSFRYYGDKLICRDFADTRYSGDIYNVVGFIIGKNCRDGKQFIEICKAIYEKVHSEKTHKSSPTDSQIIKNSNNVITSITTVDREISKLDFDNFSKFGIFRKTVEQNIIPVRRFSVNGIFTNYSNSHSDPCYKYISNLSFIKLYFPNRDKHSKTPRFITNNTLPIEDLFTMIHSDIIIICKSIKDKLLLNQLLSQFEIPNTSIQVITASSEVSMLDERIVKIIGIRAKHVFVMFDADSAGLKAMKNLQELYGYIPLLFSSDAKDPTDYCRAFGYSKTTTTFKMILNIIFEYVEQRSHSN